MCMLTFLCVTHARTTRIHAFMSSSLDYDFEWAPFFHCCRYHKRLKDKLVLPEMQLLKLVLDPSRLSWSHQGSMLTLHYSKPPALLAEVRGS